MAPETYIWHYMQRRVVELLRVGFFVSFGERLKHITTPTRSILEAPELQIPPYSRHTVVVPMVST